MGQLAKVAMVARIRACPLLALGSLAECVPCEHTPSRLVQDPRKCLCCTRSDMSPEEGCEGSRVAARGLHPSPTLWSKRAPGQ